LVGLATKLQDERAAKRPSHRDLGDPGRAGPGRIHHFYTKQNITNRQLAPDKPARVHIKLSSERQKRQVRKVARYPLPGQSFYK
jgi:hypothetical protein